MSSKKIRWARALANQKAHRVELLRQGENSLYSKWWRKIIAKLFPIIKRRYANSIDNWYKNIIKKWSKEIIEIGRDHDCESFYHARSKLINKKNNKYHI